jgi:hypothetical protein
MATTGLPFLNFLSASVVDRSQQTLGKIGEFLRLKLFSEKRPGDVVTVVSLHGATVQLPGDREAAVDSAVWRSMALLLAQPAYGYANVTYDEANESMRFEWRPAPAAPVAAAAPLPLPLPRPAAVVRCTYVNKVGIQCPNPGVHTSGRSHPVTYCADHRCPHCMPGALRKCMNGMTRCAACQRGKRTREDDGATARPAKRARVEEEEEDSSH